MRLSRPLAWLISQQGIRPPKEEKTVTVIDLPPVPKFGEQGPRTIELPSGDVAVLPSTRRRRRR